MAPVSSTSQTGRPRLWDGPTRLFHWTLVVLVAFSWWSGEEHEMEWHRWSGYGILALVVFRIFWGFAGPATVRFARFVRGPATVAAYARTLFKRGGEHVPGHNPLGGWSVVAMLAALAVMVTAGLFAVDVDGFESGPLATYITFEQGRSAAEVHEVVFNVLLALIALHVIAIVFYRVWKGQRLLPAMLHGRAPDGVELSADGMRVTWWKLALGVILAGAIAWAAAQGFRF
ncbi:cytochrome b/b6 domain-containing protein [Novosphingobium aquimarinum]|uniref:cytochrome b/b6 domain-containing protein n=1 Tax=Novosphingobium aquimarinum TaxID=2682494 RepID=UPI0012EBA1DE|nr:cytochrome b/b6 domain-containing protein [Novosphingobium aquimarinum]